MFPCVALTGHVEDGDGADAGVPEVCLPAGVLEDHVELLLPGLHVVVEDRDSDLLDRVPGLELQRTAGL